MICRWRCRWAERCHLGRHRGPTSSTCLRGAHRGSCTRPWTPRRPARARSATAAPAQRLVQPRSGRAAPRAAPAPTCHRGAQGSMGLQGAAQGSQVPGVVGRCRRRGPAAPGRAALAGFAPRPGGSQEAHPLLECRWPPGDLLGHPSLAADDICIGPLGCLVSLQSHLLVC